MKENENPFHLTTQHNISEDVNLSNLAISNACTNDTVCCHVITCRVIECSPGFCDVQCIGKCFNKNSYISVQNILCLQLNFFMFNFNIDFFLKTVLLE